MSDSAIRAQLEEADDYQDRAPAPATRIRAQRVQRPAGDGGDAPPPRTRRFAPRAGTLLVGRQRELRQLERALARAGEGRGSVVLLSGEAGIGKTRLCTELARMHHDCGGCLVLGRGYPEDTGVAFGPIADALYAARRARPPLWKAVQARARVLAGVLPELADAQPRHRGSVDRPVFYEALLDAVEEAGGDNVTLWVLEDIHWADDSTWEFVKYATRRVADMRVVVAVTYREEEVGSAHAWWAQLMWLRRDPNVEAIRLERLGTADAAQLVRSVSPSLAQDVVTSVVERAAGTPLLVEELATLAAQRGELPAVPDIVRATLRERAARLTPAAHDLLQVTAVAGLDVDADLLEALRPGRSSDELLCVGILSRDDGALRFRHPLLQEAAYADVPLALRRVLHADVAAALAQRGPRVVERVALHLERAGHPDAALASLESATKEARAASDAGRAGSLGVAALALARRHPALAAREDAIARSAIADLFRAGRWTELDPLARQAWSRREHLAPDERAWLAGVMALHLFWTGRIAESWAVLEDEIPRLEEVGDLGRAGFLLSHAASIAWLRGDGPGARAYADRACDIASAAPVLVSRPDRRLGRRAPVSGR